MSKPKDKPTPPPMAATLRAEVRHAEARLELAQKLLREWLLSHPEEGDGQPKPSVYETRGFIESPWRPYDAR
jgi:hypothetical protein